MERGHGFWRGVLFHGDKSDITGFFDVFWVRARAVVARVAPGGKSFVSPGRCHASKCLLRRQTESQRDSVHHGRFAAQPLPPDAGCRGRSSFQEEYGRNPENRVVSG